MSNESRKTVLSIQYLRAIAAAGVVVFHLAAKLPLNPQQMMSFRVGAAGVDMFFIISGFVMFYTTAGRDIGLWSFYKRRIIRVAPLYYLLTSVVLAIVIFAPSLVNIGSFDVKHLVSSYVFVAWPHPGWPTRHWPLLVPGWTLNYEMFFYLLFGISLMLPPRFRAAGMMCMFVGLVLIGATFRPDGIGEFYTSPFLLEFLAGYVLGNLYLKTAAPPPSLSFVMLSVGVGLLAIFGPTVETDGWDRVVAWGGPSLIIVGAAISLNRSASIPNWPMAALFGDASYATYLVQFLAVPVFFLTWRLSSLPYDGIWMFLYIGLGIAAVTVVGVLTHFLAELPLVKLLSGRPTVGAQRA